MDKQTKKFLKKAIGITLSIVLLLSTFPYLNDYLVGNTGTSALAEEQANQTTDKTNQSDGSPTTDNTNKDSSQDTSTNTDTKDSQQTDSTNPTDANQKTTDDIEEQNKAIQQEQQEATLAQEQNAEQQQQQTDQQENQDEATLAAASITTDNMYEGVCRVATAPSSLYCRTIDDAFDYLEANGGGTIEIYKDVTLSSSHTITQEITVKNITSGVTSTVLNPTKNGNNHNQPVVTVATAGQLIINGGTLNLKGCIFDGTKTERTQTIDVTSGTVAKTHAVASPIIVQSGNLNATTGDTPDGASEGDGIEVTTTTLQNFKSAGSGGAVVYIAGGTTTISDGLFESNTATQNGGGVFKLYEAGTLTISNGTFTNNNGVGGGGVIFANASDASNTNTVNISGGTFENNAATGDTGGGAFMSKSIANTTTISGTATFRGNSAENGYGAAINANYGKVYLQGTIVVEQNEAAAYGAVYVSARDTGEATFYLSQNPRIVNNNGGKNVYVGRAANLQVSNLGANARIGISNLTGSGTQFATGNGINANVLQYLACFSNDTNPTYIPDFLEASTSLKWREPKDADSKDYVCYITNAGITTYYISLQAALAAAAEGNTIEIFKSHEFSLGTGVEQELTKSVTIMNVCNPLNDGVNWLKNGNAKDATDNPNGEPIVSLAKADRFVVGDGTNAATVTIKGLRLKGEAAEATNTDGRQKSVMLAKGSANLKFLKGEEGTDNYGNALSSDNYATSIYNQSEVNEDGRGLLCMEADSQATLEQITMTDSLSYSAKWDGGGTIVNIIGKATLTINGGEYTGLKCRGSANWGEASIKVSTGADGTVVNMKDVYAHGNTGSHGGFITTSDSLTAELNIEDCTFIKNTAYVEGGAVYAGGGEIAKGYTTLNISGSTTFKENESARCGSAFSCRGQLNLSGNVLITGNTNSGTDSAGTYVGGAIDAYGHPSRSWKISGSPRIYGNTPADVAVYSTNYSLSVGNMLKDAHVGVQHYTADMNAAGKQFATTINASAAVEENLAGAFFNDVDKTLVSIPGENNAAIWGSAVVKETSGSSGTGAFVKYYDSLNAALDGVTDGNTLEILKDHTLTAAGTLAAGKTCYIRNVVNPINDTENPFIDDQGNIAYSTGKEPVVYFSNNDGTNITDYRLTINGIAVVEGVKFSGQSWTGTATDAGAARNRSTSGILVSATGNMTIKNGSDGGVLPDGTARDACATEITNFVNTTAGTSNYEGGAFLMINGEVTMEGGTISGCNATSSGWKGGGSVAKISGTSDAALAKFTLKGGTITNNAKTASGYSGCCFSQGQYAYFEMTGGLVDNNGRTDGAIHGAVVGGYESDVSKTIIVSGGTVSNNSANNAAFYMGKGSVTINGTAVVTGNVGSNAGSVIHTRTGCTVNIGGYARITGNTVTSGGSAAATNVSCAAIALVNTTETVNITECPVVSKNYWDDVEANVSSYAPACMNISNLNKSAHVGVYAVGTSSKEADGTFATGGTDATSAGYLAALYNDRTPDANGNPLRGADNGDQYVKWEGVTPTVKVTETVTSTNATTGDPEYTDIVHTFSGTTAISDAFACVANLPQGNYVTAKEGSDRPYQGYFPIELLYETHDDYKLTSQVSVTSGDAKQIMFTTAMTTDEMKAADMGDTGDGYPGPGTDKPATITRNAAYGSMFKLNTGYIEVQNLEFNGNRDSYKCNADGGGIFYLWNGSTLIVGDGSKLYDSECSTNFGGSIRLFGSVVTIKGDAILNNNAAVWGGAIYNDYGTLNVEGSAQLTNNTSSSAGGAIASYGSKEDERAYVNIKGNVLIYQNTGGTGGCAVRLGCYSTGTFGNGEYLDTSDNTTKIGAPIIKGNTNTEATTTDAYKGAVVMDSYGTVESAGKIIVSGNTYIYENTTGSVQTNVLDDTDTDDGTKIYVGEEGLGKGAKIGVYSDKNCDAGDIFGHTVADQASASTNSVNLARFINDKDTSLTGTAGAANAVVWSKFVPVKIIINQAAASVDTYYTLQVQSAITGARTRIPITVPAGATSGGIVTMQPAGMKGYVSCIENGSAYGYSLSNPSYTNTPNTSKGGTALGDEKDELEEATSFLCGLTVNATNANQGNINTDSGVRELSFTSTWTALDSPTKLSGQMEVTNTLKQ